MDAKNCKIIDNKLVERSYNHNTGTMFDYIYQFNNMDDDIHKIKGGGWYISIDIKWINAPYPSANYTHTMIESYYKADLIPLYNELKAAISKGIK